MKFYYSSLRRDFVSYIMYLCIYYSMQLCIVFLLYCIIKNNLQNIFEIGRYIYKYI